MEPLSALPTIHITQLTERSMSFTLQNCDLPIANKLRHTMNSEVPTIAIDIVKVEVNTTGQHDEFLAHRLGLIALQSMAANISAVEMILHVEMTCDGTRAVTAQDLISSDKRVLPSETHSEPPAVICWLRQGQELRATCVAKRGKGLHHCKWSPCAYVGFTYDSSRFGLSCKPRKFQFVLETVGQLPPQVVLELALSLIDFFPQIIHKS